MGHNGQWERGTRKKKVEYDVLLLEKAGSKSGNVNYFVPVFGLASTADLTRVNQYVVSLYIYVGIMATINAKKGRRGVGKKVCNRHVAREEAQEREWQRKMNKINSIIRSLILHIPSVMIWFRHFMIGFKQEFAARNDLVQALPDRIQAIPMVVVMLQTVQRRLGSFREIETLDQCFISCPRVITIWRKIWSWCNLASPTVFPSFSIQDISKGCVKTSGCTRTNKVLNGVLHCSIWSIWKWRNRVSHTDSDSTPKIIEEYIFPAIQRI
ncbi:hypothetical protein Tco_0810995 [Tanacetum coccineum]